MLSFDYKNYPKVPKRKLGMFTSKRKPDINGAHYEQHR